MASVTEAAGDDDDDGGYVNQQHLHGHTNVEHSHLHIVQGFDDRPQKFSLFGMGIPS